jgi:hypothetical protein
MTDRRARSKRSGNNLLSDRQPFAEEGGEMMRFAPFLASLSRFSGKALIFN